MRPRRPVSNIKSELNKITHTRYPFPHISWRKHAYLDRLPLPKPLERLRLAPGNVVHPTGPTRSSAKGEEHICPIDLDYKVIIPEDEQVGLVLAGLHPSTNIRSIVRCLKRQAPVRHFWIYSEGVCCVRFQDENAKKQIKVFLDGLKAYPFRIYDIKNRHWFGSTPEHHPPPQVLPLTAKFSQEEPKESPVLSFRTILGADRTTLVPFRRYGMLQMVYNRFYAHDKWIWEYYIKFPSTKAANLAFENHHGEMITVPYSSLSTADKLRFPFGKTQHLWLRRTGLETLPPRNIQETELYRTIFKPSTAQKNTPSQNVMGEGMV